MYKHADCAHNEYCVLQSTYTGTWAHGGGPPTNYDGAKDLGTQLSRDIKAERRRKSRLTGDDLTMGRGSPGMVSPQNYGRETSRKSAGKNAAPLDNIFSKYIAFAVFGHGAAMAEQAAADPGSVLMDSKGFAKFCKETRIMRGRLDLTRVDLIFTKFCNKVCVISLYLEIYLLMHVLCCCECTSAVKILS